MADSWQDRAEELKQEHIQQEHDDLNNEIGGRDVGRIKRFVSPESIGDEAAKADSDTFLMEVASQLLTMEQQRQVERLQQQFELYDQASKLALAEIDEEIALAHQDLERIQDNATILSDGSRAYRDENSGQFYDDEDQRLSEKDELDALDNYKSSQSTRQDRVSSTERIKKLDDERKEVENFAKENTKNSEELETNPRATLESNQNNHHVPDRVNKHYKKLSSQPDKSLDANQRPTSAAKEILDDNFDAPELNAAFSNAHDHIQPNTSEPIAPKPEQGMTLG